MSDKRSLTYFELDVPFCSRSYGALPCGARLPSTNDPVMAGFAGATLLKRGGGLTGAADSKLLTCSFWATINEAPAAPMFLVAGATTLNGTTIRVLASIDASGRLSFQCYNSAGTLILDQRSALLPLGRPFHALASFDLSNSSKRHIYIDDASALSLNNTFTNDTIDFTQADWGVGGTPGASDLFTGSVGQLWFAPGVYLDLSVSSNRRKFIDASRNPVSVGSDGSTPTGSAPLVFLGNAISTWHTNAGSGGGFSRTGTIQEADFATGQAKCFNTPKTCQDPASFDEEVVTFRFGRDVAYLPKEIDCIPSLLDAVYSPGTIKPGESLGERSTLSVTFRDGRHPDTGPGYDKYRAERDYDPVAQGTYFGKLRARQPYLRGRRCRLKHGYVGLPFAEFETHHFFVESTSGPTLSGAFTLEAKDIFKSLAAGRAMAPAMSNGFLLADISAAAGSLTLSPAGVGDEEYETSGYLAIGGKEIVAFTRVGDVVTLTSRGQKNTEAQAHKAQDRVQTVLSFVGEDPALILQTLLTVYGAVPSEYIDIDEWLTETEGFLGTVYTADICEPTPVETLANELIEQAALCMWPDDVAGKVRLTVLRAIPTEAALFDEHNRRKDSPLGIRDQPDKRVSQVWTYFAQNNPLKSIDDLDNYLSVQVTVNAVAEEANGSPAIRVIKSRWIPRFGRSVASKLNNKLLARFETGPRLFSFETMRYSGSDVELGRGYNVGSHVFQDAAGARVNVPVQVTRLVPAPDRFVVEAEEMVFEQREDDVDPAGHLIIIDSNGFNINLRSIHDALYGAPVAGDIITCRINAGVIIGSHSTALPAFDVGTWPAGIVPAIELLGRFQGAAGNGGSGWPAALIGYSGGPALHVRSEVDLDVTSGEIWGGAGGGAAYGGGPGSFSIGGSGGAGTDPGSYGIGTYSIGHAGTATLGGPGVVVGGLIYAGAGGDPGLPGGSSIMASGGAAGAAIDGISYVNLTGTGDIRGGQIN